VGGTQRADRLGKIMVEQIRVAECQIRRSRRVARVAMRVGGDSGKSGRGRILCQLLSHGPQLGRSDKGALQTMASDTLPGGEDMTTAAAVDCGPARGGARVAAAARTDMRCRGVGRALLFAGSPGVMLRVAARGSGAGVGLRGEHRRGEPSHQQQSSGYRREPQFSASAVALRLCTPIYVSEHQGQQLVQSSTVTRHKNSDPSGYRVRRKLPRFGEEFAVNSPKVAYLCTVGCGVTGVMTISPVILSWPRPQAMLQRMG